MINIDNLNVEQPRELNIDIGHTYLTNFSSSPVTDSKSNETHDSKDNETRLSDTFVETFYNNSDIIEDIKQAMRESNISYFVHKVLSKRNANADLTAEDLETNRPNYRVTFSNDSEVFHDSDGSHGQALLASLKKEDIVIERYDDSDQTGSGTGDDETADNNIEMETIMSSSSPLTQDYENHTNDSACPQFVNGSRTCSEAKQYIFSFCSNRENSKAKPSSEFFQHHKDTKSNNKNKGANLRVPSSQNSGEVECCKVADAIEVMKMLNRIMRIKEENIDLLAISRLKKEKKWRFKVGKKELIFGNKEIANLKKNGFKAYRSNIKVKNHFEKYSRSLYICRLVGIQPDRV